MVIGETDIGAHAGGGAPQEGRRDRLKVPGVREVACYDLGRWVDIAGASS